VNDACQTEYLSPCGRIVLRARSGRLVSVELCAGGAGAEDAAPTAPRAMEPFLDALQRYFQGEEAAIDARLLDLSEATEFRRRVYAALMDVPFGKVVTYGELAARVGAPEAARAVGGAVGRNPLPVLVPCHRVVAAGNRLGGFGAGLEWKRRLLHHEGWHVEEDVLVKTTPRQAPVRTCVYAGSFDPPTEGHMFMIERGAALFDHLIVAVGVNPKKKYTFTLPERLAMLGECTQGMDNVEIDSFEGRFLASYAESRDAGYVLRGIRSLEDYRYEHAMRNINEDLAPGLTTVFLMPPREICEVSSSFVKGLVGFEGWEEAIKPYVPEPVYAKLLEDRHRWKGSDQGADGGLD